MRGYFKYSFLFVIMFMLQACSMRLGIRTVADSLLVLRDVVLTSTETVVTSSKAIPVTVTFRDSVTGFDESQLIISGGNSFQFQGSGKVYTFTLVPTSSNISVQLLSGAGKFADGVLSSSSNTLSFVNSGADHVYGLCYHPSVLSKQFKTSGF